MSVPLTQALGPMERLWGPIERTAWREVPHTAGRAATEGDVLSGAAVFYVQGRSDAASISLPACAIQRLDDGSSQEVVVIQAEHGPSGICLGVRPLSGGNGICTADEVIFVPAGFLR